MAIQKVVKEYGRLKKKPLKDVTLLKITNVQIVRFVLSGPQSTPYFNGRFLVELRFSSQYPQKPPKGFFLTKIYHPNVSRTGEICVDTLKRDWNSSVSLRHIIIVIRCLLIIPNPNSALNGDAGQVFNENYELYVEKAKMYTQIYALGKKNGENLSSIKSFRSVVKKKKSVEKGKGKFLKDKRKKNVLRSVKTAFGDKTNSKVLNKTILNKKLEVKKSKIEDIKIQKKGKENVTKGVNTPNMKANEKEKKIEAEEKKEEGSKMTKELEKVRKGEVAPPVEKEKVSRIKDLEKKIIATVSKSPKIKDNRRKSMIENKTQKEKPPQYPKRKSVGPGTFDALKKGLFKNVDKFGNRVSLSPKKFRKRKRRRSSKYNALTRL